MYKNPLKDKKIWFWVIGNTIGLISGIIAAFFSSTYTLEYLSISGATCGFFLGFAQGLFLPKLFNQRIFAINNHILVKWILATTFGMFIGGGITSLLGRFISNPAVVLISGVFITIISLSFAQGLVMRWEMKKIYSWLFANLLGFLSSGTVGVLVYFLCTSIVVGLTGGGLGALFVLIPVAGLSISLSTGLIYGSITGLFLLRLLNDKKV
ncbi:hypothetical protein H6G36_01280 [Anabaena minutissima FACHB-250]|nr:hypothetical protein [Anabaena minutissima FACHB-250]